mmetsp:Transcript_14086/g.44080  ORF Transcript_14086/g.44080 Transcript_14086/m.44080 type:complete len:246 (+) Transcript_14086:819-1556(+)
MPSAWMATCASGSTPSCWRKRSAKSNIQSSISTSSPSSAGITASPTGAMAPPLTTRTACSSVTGSPIGGGLATSPPSLAAFSASMRSRIAFTAASWMAVRRSASPATVTIMPASSWYLSASVPAPGYLARTARLTSSKVPCAGTSTIRTSSSRWQRMRSDGGGPRRALAAAASPLAPLSPWPGSSVFPPIAAAAASCFLPAGAAFMASTPRRRRSSSTRASSSAGAALRSALMASSAWCRWPFAS